MTFRTLPAPWERSVNAVWTYEAPYGAAAAIKDHVAFDARPCDAIEERRKVIRRSNNQDDDHA